MNTIKNIFTINFLFFFPIVVFSQGNLPSDSYVVKSISVEDVTKEMSKGQQRGFKVNIYQLSKRETQEKWEKAIRRNTKSKPETLDNEVFINGTALEDISATPVNVYAVLNEYKDYIELFTFFELDSAVFLSNESETEYLAAKRFVRDFAVDTYEKGVQNEIEEEEKKLKSLESDLDKIHKENDKLQKKISEEKRNIDNAKEKIATSELDQERLRKQVQEQKSEVTQAKTAGNETLLKEKEKILKSIEGEMSKSLKQEDGSHKGITKSEANIRQYERDLSDNNHEQTMKQDDVNKQKEHINNLQKKLESIK